MNTCQTILDKLIKTISSSSLEDGQKQVWYNFINNITGQEIAMVMQTIEDDPNNLDFLSKNLQNKLQLIKTQNKTALEKILKEEEKYLDNYNI